MNKKRFYDTWLKCSTPCCNQQATDLHELFGGKSAKKGSSLRDICIEHDIQILVCRDCHTTYEREKAISHIWGASILGVDPDELKRAVLTNDTDTLRRLQADINRNYWSKYKEHMRA